MSDKKNIYKVSLFNNKTFKNVDIRRKINGVVGYFGHFFEFKQIKIIEFDQKAVDEKKVIGNHCHYFGSNAWEMIIIISEQSTPQVDFRYRNYSEKKVNKKKLKAGNVAVIPPGCSLALLPLTSNVKIIEISSMTYDANNYIEDILF